MNIFVLHESPLTSAHYMCDKHIVKMPVETAQMLSTVHRMLDGTEYVDYSKNGRRIKRWTHWLDGDMPDGKYLYHATMMNHPCTIWARETLGNYMWLVYHGLELCREYTRRYDRRHASESIIEFCHNSWPKNIDRDTYHKKTPFAQAMPDEYKVKGDAVSAYRKYYIGEKSGFAKWKKGIGRCDYRKPHDRIPNWYREGLTKDENVVQYA